MRMFHAACAASQRPGRSPTRGSGDGAVAETIGSTGFGITAGGGGGGGGGGGDVPPPPGGGVAPGAVAAEDVPASGVTAGGAAGGVADGSLGGAAEGAGVAGAAAGGAAGGAAGVEAFLPAVVQANHPSASATTNSVRVVLIVSYPPAFRACVRFRSLDRRTRPTRI